MKLEELQRILVWFYNAPDAIFRSTVSWLASFAILCLVITYGVQTVNSGSDDHFKYGVDNACVYKNPGSDQPYWHVKGYTPVNNTGHCNGTGVLVRSTDYGKYFYILRNGTLIALSPFLLVFLNGGVLRSRKLVGRGITSVKSSAVKKAIDATKGRRAAEARSDQMERDLALANRELDDLLKS